MKQSPDSKTIALIGAGAVGKALAQALSQAGVSITTILDHSAGAAKNLALSVGAQRHGSDFGLIKKDTRLILIAAPDDEIVKVDRMLSKLLSGMNLIGVGHTSGALPGSELKSLSALGVPVGSLHPLQTFPAKGLSPSLLGIYFTVEGDDSLRPILTGLVTQMGGIPVELPSEGKILYHTAAVFASNFIPVLLREARELMLAAGISDSQIRPMLAPLMRASLDNCLKSGEVEALTGPIARGDAATVERHLEALKTGSSGTLAVYRMLCLKALELAIEKGLNEEAAENVQKILMK